ncbi:IS3 family transposase [Shewanella aestuarii]|uniref:IS3 family transposase n=1 Tax=Shewanella aestuarii TaxID=1028752 RepID=A0A6G9QLK7_9GAMM|nr:IS3 family transposase [Shewanella aestuarii]QIR15426.1 IS3 family transposase [Shewanella aestuarii]
MIVLALKNEYSLKHLLNAVELPRSVFYYQKKSLGKPVPYQEERKLISDIYHEHKGRYGYRRVHLELRKTYKMNKKTVQRLMLELGLKSTVRPKKYSSYKGEQGQVAPNVLKRDFNADKPDEKWVTDVTEFKVKGQKVYLSPVIDTFNQEVVAYRVEKHVRLTLVTGMLEDSLAKLDSRSKPIVHSDQGWQYRHSKYKKMLKDAGLTQSMSRKGNCLDNAVAENFFALLKTEMYHGRQFESANELISAIKEYITYYNQKRIKVKLKGLTPVEYRNQALKEAA